MAKPGLHTFTFLPQPTKADGTNWYPGGYPDYFKNLTNSDIYNHRIENLEELKEGVKVINQYCLPSHYLPQLVCLSYNPDINPFNLYFGSDLGFNFIGNGRPLMYFCDEESDLRLDGNRAIMGLPRKGIGNFSFAPPAGPTWALPNPRNVSGKNNGERSSHYDGLERIMVFNGVLAKLRDGRYNPNNTGIPADWVMPASYFAKENVAAKLTMNAYDAREDQWCGWTVNYYLWNYWNRLDRVKEMLEIDGLSNFYDPPIDLLASQNVQTSIKNNGVNLSLAKNGMNQIGTANFSSGGKKDHRWAFYYPDDVLMTEQVMPDGSKMIDPYGDGNPIQPYHISPGDIVVWGLYADTKDALMKKRLAGKSDSPHIGFATGAHKLLIRMQHEDPAKRAAFSGEKLIIELTVEPWKEKLTHSAFPYEIKPYMIRPWKWLDRVRPLYGDRENCFLSPDGTINTRQSRTLGQILPTEAQNPLINPSYPEWGRIWQVSLHPWSYIKEFKGSGYTVGDILIPERFGTEEAFVYNGSEAFAGRGNKGPNDYNWHAVRNFRITVEEVGPNTYKQNHSTFPSQLDGNSPDANLWLLNGTASRTVQNAVLEYSILSGTVGVPVCYESIEGNTNIDTFHNGCTMLCKFTRVLSYNAKYPVAGFLTYIGNMDGSKPGACQVGIPRV
jgi:hypothetical protein